MTRLIKHKNYTVICNGVFTDNSLSLKAKGLLCQMLSLPNDCEFTTEGLTKLTSDGKTSVKNAIKELDEHGYLKRKQKRENGKFGQFVYFISDYPNMSKKETYK